MVVVGFSSNDSWPELQSALAGQFVLRSIPLRPMMSWGNSTETNLCTIENVYCICFHVLFFHKNKISLKFVYLQNQFEKLLCAPQTPDPLRRHFVFLLGVFLWNCESGPRPNSTQNMFAASSYHLLGGCVSHSLAEPVFRDWCT